MKQLESLPIDLHIQEIVNLVNKHQNVVIKSSPGSGKTTRIPASLNTYFKKILVLEPRRIAAISAAKRIATEQGWVLGEKVGYHVRFDKKYSDKTEIVFLTEALLAKFLLHQNYLETIDLIILDEFHERSQWTDLCLGLIKEWQDLGLKTKLCPWTVEVIAEFVGVMVTETLFPTGLHSSAIELKESLITSLK